MIRLRDFINCKGGKYFIFILSATFIFSNCITNQKVQRLVPEEEFEIISSEERVVLSEIKKLEENKRGSNLIADNAIYFDENTNKFSDTGIIYDRLLSPWCLRKKSKYFHYDSLIVNMSYEWEKADTILVKDTQCKEFERKDYIQLFDSINQKLTKSFGVPVVDSKEDSEKNNRIETLYTWNLDNLRVESYFIYSDNQFQKGRIQVVPTRRIRVIFTWLY